MSDTPFPAFADHVGCGAMHTVEEIADAITRVAQLARTLVETERCVDLAGLETMVGLLCARALDLYPAQGRQVRPRLATLMLELDALSAALARDAPD